MVSEVEAAGNRGGKMKAVRVLIAHPDEAVAEKLRAVIEGDPRVAVVATAERGDACVKKVGITWPTVVVMDTRFPDMTAARVIQKLSQTRVPLAVLICSGNAQKGAPELEEALAAGAYNFILLPPNLEDIDTIGRQILTTIHVTGFSKTKNIPQMDPKVGVKDEASTVPHAQLNCVVMDVAPQHLPSVGWLLCRVHPQGEPAVIVVVRQPAGGAANLVAEFGPKLHTSAEPFADNAVLSSGRILVLDEGSASNGDLVAGLDQKDRVVLKQVRSDGSRRGMAGPDPVRLYSTLADRWSQTFAVIMFGKPTSDAGESMVAAKERGALTLAYEHSTDLLSDVNRRFADDQIPDDIVTLEQIDRFMNAVLITGRG